MDHRIYSFGFEVFRMTVWLALLCAIFIPLERIFPQRQEGFFRKQVGIDLIYYFTNSLVVGAVIGAPLALAALGAHAAIPDAYYARVAAFPTWARLGLSFFVAELGFYWAHRISHTSSFLWRFHSVHHSAEHMDFLVNTRAHIIDLLFVRLIGFVPLYVLGLANPFTASGSLAPLLISVVGIIWGFFIHANIRLRFGFLEHLVATPAFHHWHHTVAAPLDRNFAATLPLLDHLFRTMHLPSAFPPAYGVKDGFPETLMGQITGPFSLQHKIAPVDATPPH